jgi:lipoate-protein ligase A
MAFHEQTLIVDWLVPDTEPRRHVHQRFTLFAERICAALRSLEVDARLGEIAGEYCPGQYSINIGGDTKVAGVAQRVYSRGAHLGAAIVVAEEPRLRDVLFPVYAALGLEWDPRSLGSVASWTAGIGCEAEFTRPFAKFAS